MNSAELQQYVEDYFDAHLDKSYWSGLSEDTRVASVAMAHDDIMSAINNSLDISEFTVDESTGEYSVRQTNCLKAIAEQAVFLSRNYENLTENKVVTSEGIEGISTGYTLIGDSTIALRAAKFIQLIKKGAGVVFRFGRG